MRLLRLHDRRLWLDQVDPTDRSPSKLSAQLPRKCNIAYLHGVDDSSLTLRLWSDSGLILHRTSAQMMSFENATHADVGTLPHPMSA